MTGAARERRARRVLVVDDDEGIRSVVAEALGDEGFEVRAAADGLEALEALEQPTEAPPDVVLLDYSMPRCDGPTFARRYRRRGAAAPIVLLTASHQVEARCREVAADGCMGKPFDLDTLVETIEELTHSHAHLPAA